MRFRILLDLLPLTDLIRIPEFIIACCVLYNIRMSQDDFFKYNEVQTDPAPGKAFVVAESGINKRVRIMNELPM